MVSARNVSQLDVGANTARYRIEPVWRRSVSARLPLRTAHADSGAGFYSHRAAYTSFAWGRWSRSASGVWWGCGGYGSVRRRRVGFEFYPGVWR